jgi:hypothetical protein
MPLEALLFGQMEEKTRAEVCVHLPHVSLSSMSPMLTTNVPGKTEQGSIIERRYARKLTLSTPTRTVGELLLF